MNTNRINAAYSFMDNYAQHAGLSIMSLFEHNKDVERIDVFIIDGGIGDLNKQNLNSIAVKYGRNIIFVDLEKISSNMKVDTNFCRSTYGKLFLSQITDVDRMLAFDCDTIVTGSLSELLDYDMENILVAGVQDTVNPYYVSKAQLSNGKRYINCGGVIVLNLQLWREMNIEQRCLEYVLEHEGNPPFVDQGTINYICKDHIKVLSPHYNLINPMFMFSVERIKKLFKIDKYYTQAEVDDAKSNPIVIHYTGEFFNRPWFSNCTHPLKKVYLDYLEQSPWKENKPSYKEMSKNCRIQNWVYHNTPFCIYKLMIRFIELRHRLTKRVM